MTKGTLASNNKEETVKVHLPTRRLHGVLSRVSESVWKKADSSLPLVEPLNVHGKSSQKKNVGDARSGENQDLFRRVSVNSLGSNVNSSQHAPARWDESSFSNVYKPIPPSEKGGSKAEKPLSLEDNYEVLKQQEQEWKLKAKRSREEVDEKAEIVEALKKKVAELVVKLQEEQRLKIQEQERCKQVRGEFEDLARSLEWHQKQLHECQVARDRAQKELNEEKQRSPRNFSQPCSVENRKGSSGSSSSEKVCADASQPVQYAADCPPQSLVQERLRESQRWAKEEKAHWEAMVAELELQVESWKKEAGLLSGAVTQSERERAAWLGRIAEMQERLEEGATESEGLKGKLREAESRFAAEEERRRVAEGEREALKAALTGALKEKTVLDGAVECIRNDFERVRKSFELMKSILAQREKEILEMRAANSKREAEVALAEQRRRGGNDSKVFADDMPKDSRAEVIGPPEPSKIQRSGNENSDQAERNVEDASKSSIFGTSPCCIAAMERVDLEWRQKHKTSVRALIKKLNQKQKRLMESENLCGDILDPVKGTQIQLPQTIPPFSVLPVPTKLNESMIMQLISKGQEVIKRSNNYCMAPLKPSLVSLEDEVRNLENKIKCTFPAEQLRNFPALDVAKAMK